jgi:hypothetical protein
MATPTFRHLCMKHRSRIAEPSNHVPSPNARISSQAMKEGQHRQSELNLMPDLFPMSDRRWGPDSWSTLESDGADEVATPWKGVITLMEGWSVGNAVAAMRPTQRTLAALQARIRRPVSSSPRHGSGTIYWTVVLSWHDRALTNCQCSARLPLASITSRSP